MGLGVEVSCPGSAWFVRCEQSRLSLQNTAPWRMAACGLSVPSSRSPTRHSQPRSPHNSRNQADGATISG